MVQIRPPKTRTTAAKESCAKHYVNRLPEEAQGQQMVVGTAGGAVSGRPVAGRVLGGWAGALRLSGRLAAGQVLCS